MHYPFALSLFLSSFILNFALCFGQFEIHPIHQEKLTPTLFSNDIKDIDHLYDEERIYAPTPDCLVSRISILPNLNPTFGFNVFPNPNKGEFCVHFERMSSALQIELSNTQGELLCMKQNPMRATHFSLPELSSGTYVVTVSDDTRTVSARIQIER
jgi:hypothetical protein